LYPEFVQIVNHKTLNPLVPPERLPEARAGQLRSIDATPSYATLPPAPTAIN
jgi:hypothetical protein